MVPFKTCLSCVSDELHLDFQTLLVSGTKGIVNNHTHFADLSASYCTHAVIFGTR